MYDRRASGEWTSLVDCLKRDRNVRLLVRPERTPIRVEILGVLGFLSLIVLIDRFQTNVHPLPSSFFLFLIATIAMSFWAGLRSGIIAVLLMIGYVWLVGHYPDKFPVGRQIRDAEVAVFTFTVLCGVVSVGCGTLHTRLRRAAIREVDAREAAQVEAEHRRAAEAELWASENMRCLIVDSSVDAIVGIAEDGTITMWNPNAEKLFGWTRGEAIGSRIGICVPALVHPLYPHETPALSFHADKAAPTQPHAELTVRTKAGEELAVEVHIADRQTERGRILILFARDVSERKRAAEAIRDLNLSLEARVERRTQQFKAANDELLGFTYSVSHDLRAPLRSIVLNSRIVCDEADGRLDDETMSRVKRLEVSALKMADIIDSLLKYARLGQMPIDIKEVDLSEMADRVGQDLCAQREGTVDVQPGLCAHGDPELIQLVLLNLMENAWKYVARGQAPRVEIGAGADETIYVRDHGIGFDMKYEAKVWEPFQRLHGEGEYPGTGIGLANCKRIVERHGGRIWAESVPGEGTTIRFRFADPANSPKRIPSRRTIRPTGPFTTM